MLAKAIESTNNETKRRHLVKLCETPEFLYDDKQLDELHNKIDNSLSRIACRCYLTQ
ncbi:unnamed protein product, partial [Adineta steineri]